MVWRVYTVPLFYSNIPTAGNVLNSPQPAVQEIAMHANPQPGFPYNR